MKNKIEAFLSKSVFNVVFVSVLASQIIYTTLYFALSLKDGALGFIISFFAPLVVSFFVGKWIVSFNKRLNKANQELISLNRKLKVQNANNIQMLSLVAHDVRSPLASAKSSIELLKEQHNEDLLEKIERRFNNTLISVDKLLTWAKNQFNETKINIEHHKLDELIKFEINSIESQLRSKNISLNTESISEINIAIDKNSFSIILRNILNNAIKYSKQGGEIKISAQNNNGRLVLSISDKGIGMSKKTLESVLVDKNYKSTLGTNNEDGFGIGLKLVKSHVDLNHGSISVESQLDFGTTFHLSFPNGEL
ncbi:MAG: HAMP domain-containing histidine kinase [Bacteroidia bacterium]